MLLVQSGVVRSGPVLAFHDGGTASCNACHVMHTAVPGEVLWAGSDPLLTATTASDVCLSCHGGADGVFSDTPLLPGPERGAGNFVFLLEDNLNDGLDGQVNPISGDAAGHNIVSPDFGITADPRWPRAPGGNFPSSQLACTSCHDPHGNANFRMLYGAGEIQGGIAVFTDGAPVAMGLDITASLQTEAPDQHTAYISGMSAWCANCHGQYHDRGDVSNFEHDYEEGMDSEEITNYNEYEGSSSPNSGFAISSYLPEVPFEDPSAKADRMQGPTNNSTVMCLTCHRAHASSAPASGRWDFRVADLNRDGEVSGSYGLPNPYPGAQQGSLCAKCHGSEQERPHYMSE